MGGAILQTVEAARGCFACMLGGPEMRTLVVIAHLRAQGVAIEEGPGRATARAGGGQSVYFRDPDGSVLEFIVY